MELRKAEAEVEEIKVSYESLCRAKIISSDNCQEPQCPSCNPDLKIEPTAGNDDAPPHAAAGGALSALPPLSGSLAKVRQDRPAAAPPADGADGGADQQESAAAFEEESSKAQWSGEGLNGVFISAKEALTSLETLKARLDDLEAKCTKFRKRLGEKDPITDAPRYGAKTASRVVALLDMYDALVLSVDVAFGNDDSSSSSSCNVLQSLRQSVAHEEEMVKQSEAKSKTAAMEEAARAAEYAKKLEEEQRQKEEAERENRRQQEIQLHQQAIEARQRREEEEARAAREECEAERAFVESIPKGPDGVRAQLKALREGCATEPGSFDIAIGALHTLFSQISSHPEEIKFRRIRRDHPKFLEDIGRHPGGKEVFIAAGFKLETLDGVKSFFSKEPDLESDMDGWSKWFDGLKKALAIIEEEIVK